jgi:hypothetical protein
VVWVNEPDMPVTVRLLEDAETDAAAATVMRSGVPGVTCGLAGEMVTPDGKLLMESETVEAKPLTAITVAVKVVFPPPVTVTLDGETDRVKS